MKHELLLIIVLSMYFSSLLSKEMYSSENEKPVIGIHIGTTNSRMSLILNNGPVLIPNLDGDVLTPSVVAITHEMILVGKEAHNYSSEDPKRFFYNLNNIIGSKYIDIDVRKGIMNSTYEIINGLETTAVSVKLNGRDKTFSTTDIYAFLIMYLKRSAVIYLEREVKNVIFTVPAYFNDQQRHAVKDAATKARLNTIRLLNSPTATAIAYNFTRIPDKKVLVFHLGGETSDASVLNIEDEVVEIEEVTQNTHLGGYYFNKRVIDYIIKFIKDNYGKDIINNSNALNKLDVEVEKAKRFLSTNDESVIEIKDLVDGFSFNMTLTRNKFEELCDDLFQSSIDLIDKTLDKASIQKNEIKDIVLTGGSTKIPRIQQLIKEFFDGREPLMTIDPSFVESYGAAIQGDVISSERNDHEFICGLSYTKLTLGVEIQNGVMKAIIPRGNILPTRKSTIHKFNYDEKPMKLNIYEGERLLVKYNHHIGTLELNEFTISQNNTIDVEIEFAYSDIEEYITVAANDKNSIQNKSVTAKIELPLYTFDQIETMISDAEDNKEFDLKVVENFEFLQEQKNEPTESGYSNWYKNYV